MINEQLTLAAVPEAKPTSGKFDKVLEAWRDGKDTAWSELMTVWVDAPTAPRSLETIVKLIKHLDKG
jgi:hypothetical protein